MNIRKIAGKILVIGGALLLPMAAWASHPLITDDAGTQGKGKYQLEVNGEFDSDKEDGIKTTGGQAATALTYGVIDTVDIAVGLPYVWYSVNNGGPSASGISDATIDVKVRFFEKDGLSFAVKPGISFPTGDDEKGLGSGKTGYHVFLIGSKEAAPWTFHANIGYIRNETKADIEEKDLWHVSVAATYEVAKNVKAVADIGEEKNPDRTADNDPAYLVLGAIYGVNENLDLDAGVKFGLTKSETDVAFPMVGMAYRF
jgi:predicted porin